MDWKLETIVVPVSDVDSITLMRNKESAGTLQGLHLVVSDIGAARAELVQEVSSAT